MTVSRFTFLAVGAVALLMMPTRPVGAAHGLHVVTVEAGVRLTLSLDGQVYPRNALVRATVSLQNVSRHRIVLGTGCVSGSPGVEVYAASGAVLYPPAVPDLISPSCGGPDRGRPTLEPGQVMRRRLYAILRSPRLAAVAFVGEYNTSIVTPDLTVRLVGGRPPRVVMSTSGPVSARIQAIERVGGRLLAAMSYRCKRGLLYSGGTSWVVVRAIHVAPACSRVSEWYLAVGWLNHSVAVVHYVRR